MKNDLTQRPGESSVLCQNILCDLVRDMGLRDVSSRNKIRHFSIATDSTAHIF